LPEGGIKEEQKTKLIAAAKDLEAKQEGAKGAKQETQEVADEAVADALDEVESAKVENTKGDSINNGDVHGKFINQPLTVSLIEASQKVAAEANAAAEAAQNGDAAAAAQHADLAVRHAHQAVAAAASNPESMGRTKQERRGPQERAITTPTPASVKQHLSLSRTASQNTAEEANAAAREAANGNAAAAARHADMAVKHAQQAAILSAHADKVAKMEKKSAEVVKQFSERRNQLKASERELIRQGEQVRDLPPSLAQKAAIKALVDAAHKLESADKAVRAVDDLKAQEKSLSNEAQQVSSMAEGVTKDKMKIQLLQQVKALQTLQQNAEATEKVSLQAADSAQAAAFEKVAAAKVAAQTDGGVSTSPSSVTRSELKDTESLLVEKAHAIRDLPESGLKKDAREALIDAAHRLETADKAAQRVNKLKLQERDLIYRGEEVGAMDAGVKQTENMAQLSASTARLEQQQSSADQDKAIAVQAAMHQKDVALMKVAEAIAGSQQVEAGSQHVEALKKIPVDSESPLPKSESEANTDAESIPQAQAALIEAHEQANAEVLAAKAAQLEASSQAAASSAASLEALRKVGIANSTLASEQARVAATALDETRALGDVRSDQKMRLVADKTLQATLEATLAAESRKEKTSVQKSAAIKQAKQANADLAKLRRQASDAAMKADNAEVTAMKATERQRQLKIDVHEASKHLDAAKRAVQDTLAQKAAIEEDGNQLGRDKVTAVHVEEQYKEELDVAENIQDPEGLRTAKTALKTAQKKVHTLSEESHEKAEESNAMDTSSKHAATGLSIAAVALSKAEAVHKQSSNEAEVALSVQHRLQKEARQKEKEKRKAEKDADSANKLQAAAEAEAMDAAHAEMITRKKHDLAITSDRVAKQRLGQASLIRKALDSEMQKAEAVEMAQQEKVVALEKVWSGLAASEKSTIAKQQQADEHSVHASVFVKKITSTPLKT